MKKLSTNTSLMSLVLGTALILYALTFIGGGTEATIIGVFGIVFGVAYIFSGLLTILNISNSAVEITKGSISIAAFPLFKFIFYLIIIIVAASSLDATNWILLILLLIASLATVIMGVASFFTNKEQLLKVLRLAIYVFIGLLVIIMVFPVGGGTASIGDLSILDILFLACYYLITKPIIEGK